MLLILVLSAVISGCHRPLGYFPENSLPQEGTEIPGASESSTVCRPVILSRTAQSSAEPVPIPGETHTFPSDQIVTFSCGTPDAELYYTLDGTDPDPAEGIGTLWDGETGIEIAGLGESALIKVIAAKPLMFPSCITQSEITIGRLPAPSLSVQSGTYSDVQTVTVTCETEGAGVYYTDDGTEPDSGSLLLPEAPENTITVDRNTELKFITLKEHCYDSDISAGEYRFKPDPPEIIKADNPLSNFPTLTVDIPENFTLHIKYENPSFGEDTYSVYPGPHEFSKTVYFNINAYLSRTGWDDGDVIITDYTMPEATAWNFYGWNEVYDRINTNTNMNTNTLKNNTVFCYRFANPAPSDTTVIGKILVQLDGPNIDVQYISYNMDGSILLNDSVADLEPMDFLYLNDDPNDGITDVVDFQYVSNQLKKVATKAYIYIHEIGVIIPDIPEL